MYRLFLLCALIPVSLSAAALKPEDWAVEQMPGGTVEFQPNQIMIRDARGCTVWLRQKLTAPVAIHFTATLVGGDRATDRISDLNCFWMANDSRGPGAPFLPPWRRSGKFSEYDSLLTYYVGYAANNNSTTRFRRYDGTTERPLLPEHDLSGPQFKLRKDVPVKIRLIARDGVAEYWRDGERIFVFRDPAPLASGWFAFRTVRSHIRIEHFVVESLTESSK